MDTQEQRRQARNLYFGTDMTRQEIAAEVNINRKTLYLWIKEGGWRHGKYAAAHAPSLLADQYYEQLGALNKSIAERKERPWPTKEEASIIRMLTNAIHKMTDNRYSVVNSVQTLHSFCQHLRYKQNNLPLTQEIIKYMDNYVKDLKDNRSWLSYNTIQDEEQEFEHVTEESPTTQAETSPNSSGDELSTANCPLPTATVGNSPLEGEREDAPAEQLPIANRQLPNAPLGNSLRSQNADDERIEHELRMKEKENGASGQPAAKQIHPHKYNVRHPRFGNNKRY